MVKIVLALAALVLFGVFSAELLDSDFWWHLKTGQYIVEHHALPVPDPFAFTTARADQTVTGHFNLTHEWLAQAIFFLVYKLGGFPALVLFRTAILAAFSALAGLISWRRSGGFYRSLAAAFACAWVALPFALDRPYIFTFLFLAITVTILERRRTLWLLPPLFLVWANCHGGFILGWVAAAAYVIDWRKWKLALWPAIAVLASGLNPNGFRAFQVLLDYRRSFMQSTLLEWAPPPLWPPQPFFILIAAAAIVLLIARHRVRVSDWILFVAFSAAATNASRNTVLAGFIAPVMVVSYTTWKRPVPRLAPFAATAVLAIAFAAGAISGSFYQLRAAEWRYPTGAADFILAHHITQPMFNTYEYGGYLMWRLWPQEKVFIDGRALSEPVFRDYAKILYDREDGRAQLDRYGIQLMVMNGFQYSLGLVYDMALQTDWKLVYTDPQAMIFMRNPPAGIQPLDHHLVYDHMEQECRIHIDREPRYPRCARALGQIFSKAGELTRAREWIGLYLSHPHAPDPEAEEAYTQLVGMGK